MQSLWLPEYACDKLDQINRNFLWSADATAKKIHLVGWSKVTKPKKDGGLGIRIARISNEALLAKIAWKVISNEESVWKALVHAKYLKKSRLIDYVAKPWDSATWKGIVRCVALMKPFLRWKIGDGRTIRFWIDNWLGPWRLCEENFDIHPDDMNLRLRDVCNEDGDWIWSSFRTEIPSTLREELESRNIKFSKVDDIVIWNETSSGLFLCKSAYHTFHKNYHEEGSAGRNNNWVWRVNLSNKLRHFLWLAGQERLATNRLRKTRKLSQDANCLSCECEDESVLHVLHQCRSARKVWCKILRGTELARLNDMGDDIWLRENALKGKLNCKLIPNCDWATIFVATCWTIWKAKNEKIFRNKEESSTTIVFKIKALGLELQRAQRKKGAEKKTEKWRKPDDDWFKLNVDGSVSYTRNSGVAAGVLRSHRGEWQWGFATHINTPTVDEAELEALRKGLSLAWERRIPRIEVETDSLSVYKMVTDMIHLTDPQYQKAHECITLIRKPWTCKIKWIPRTANRVADSLAKFMLCHEEGELFWDKPPTQVVELLNFDMA